ncbi:MAG: cell surface protein SprA, partial [Flavobacteriaceae bacterium]
MKIFSPKINLKYCAVALFFSFSSILWAQQTPTVRDSTSTTFSFSDINAPDPSSIVNQYTYDPITDRYYYTSKVGDFNIKYPVILTPKEFQALIQKENLKNYYKEKLDAFDGKKEGAEDAKKNLIPDLYVNSKFFETIFGGNVISVVPQGSVEMDLGVMYTKQENPAFSPRNQSNFTFDFDQRISLSMMGKVGTRLQVNANYDTQSTFDFQNLIKLEFDPTAAVLEEISKNETIGKGLSKANDLKDKTQGFKNYSGNDDTILKKLEVGNVSMPLNSSLIRGAQSLFGVKAQLQFGKTTITGVFSEQQSETRSIVAQGGGTLQEFDFFGLDYDENRHFFLAQYFRDHYDEALANYPFINSQVQITRIEVWVTNRTNQTENVRNVLALQDLGESSRIGLAIPPTGFVNVGPNAYPNNANNDFDPTNIGGPGSQLTDAVRDIATAQS